MDYKEIKALIEAVNDSTLSKFELKSGDTYIKMSKKTKPPKIVTHVEKQEENVGGTLPTIILPEEKPVQLEGHIIKSPIVGTFYESPSPEKSAYVKVGDPITAGQTLCIVEAMKIMNEIVSDVDGTVVEILVNNEDMVEFNQPLFRIKR